MEFDDATSHSHTSKQLAGVKGLGEIVVGTSG